MDDNWLSKLDKTTVIVAPTRSLVTSLNERLARQHLADGRSVWEAPSILVWNDYLRALWQTNRKQLASTQGALSLISAQQSLLVWTQIIEQSRRDEQALTLLNVQQTARAVQRSWRLMHDWNVAPESIAQDHVADTEQFLVWLDDYQQKLQKRGLIDESMLVAALHQIDCDIPYSQMIWVSYDLITDAQKAHLEQAKIQGISVDYQRPTKSCRTQDFLQFPTVQNEILSALKTARHRLESSPDSHVSIVVPDLQHRQAAVEELARSVFYPDLSPLQVQQNSNIYRFSLGLTLHEWPAIETALSLLTLIKNRVSVTDLSYLLRNQFVGLCVMHREECRVFERWLKRQRFHQVMFDHLPDLYAQCKAALSVHQRPQADLLEAQLRDLVAQRQLIQGALAEKKQTLGYAALEFGAWTAEFSNWLRSWGWQTSTLDQTMNSVQYQLHQRWIALLEEFAGLATVQHRAGLSRALELIQQMARNTVFLPKSAASPIVISGVLEAVGHEVDLCIVTGMHQDYPPAPKADAFIPARLLADSGHPSGGTRNGSQHAFQVLDHLLECADERIVSFARSADQDSDIEMGPAARFRDAMFVAKAAPLSIEGDSPVAQSEVELEPFVDVQGLPWRAALSPKGGSRIFENQSQCAFKAYATHQLQCQSQDDAEFGLDNLDRGNVVHHLLDKLWAQLQTQRTLNQMPVDERARLVASLIEQVLENNELELNAEKLQLLRLETPRLLRLLVEWLALESARPEPFSVVEREQPRRGNIGGIAFDYIIDRVDLTDAGRSVIIDYKTGNVNRNDWLEDRLRSPQMPLYVLALDAEKEKQTSGIAFASVRQGDHKFVELSETGIFREAKKPQNDLQQKWQERRSVWPQLLTQLAADFLAGQASVNPIDEQVCNYCDLHAICRVSQLRIAAGKLLGDADD
ncbi:PD-(D/E)XK nuclease family protein [Arenicella xantha]|uniref:Putative DNA repair protein n=1 Tax=Arenicella xantha TaxID=644221 RepID=A0A395JP19_9GAMM|nr:PD-(D/E)XK nuclease family protein [Arenicella xantha]RBP53401.1 putative DNA repair protein [Arenicella xantha]